MSLVDGGAEVVSELTSGPGPTLARTLYFTVSENAFRTRVRTQLIHQVRAAAKWMAER